MTYQTKYRLQYTPRNDVKTYIDLKQRDYSGAVTDVTGGPNPLEFSLESEGDAFNETIKGSSVTIELMSDSDFQYSAMFNDADAKSWRVDIYKGDKDTEIILNRDFQGSFDQWIPSTGGDWVIDKDVAKVNNTIDDVWLTAECDFPEAGTYNVRVYYANAKANETLDIIHVGSPVGAQTISTAFGTKTFSLVVGAGNLTEPIVVRKSWTGTAAESNIYIKELSILPEASAEFSHDYNIFWKGFVQPDLYSEPLFYQPYPVQIFATCGLGKLENLIFAYMAGSAESIHTRTQLEIIQDCLDNTGIYLPVKSTINLFEADLMTDGEDPLNELTINQEVFFDYDEKNNTRQEVIAKILKPYFARIIQSAGFWRIERIPYKRETQTYYWYDVFGNELQDSLTQSDLLTLTTVDAVNLVRYEGQRQYIELDYSWQNINLEQDKGYSDSVIMGEFDAIHWTDDYTPRYWSENNSINCKRNTIEGNCAKIRNISASPLDVDNHPYLQHTVGSLSGVYNFDWHSFEISYDVRLWSGNLNIDISMPIMVFYYDGGKNIYLNSDGEWTSTEAIIPSVFSATTNNRTNWRTFTLTSDYAYHTGPLYIRIYRGYTGNTTSFSDGYVEVRKFRVKAVGSYINETPRTTEYVINADNFKLPEFEEFHFGDLGQDYLLFPIDSRRVYKGLLVKGDAISNASWSEWGGGERLDLIHGKIKQDYQNQFKHSRHMLKANIYGPVTFESVIVDPDNNDRYFLPIGLKINDIDSITSGTWIEIYKPELDTDDVIYDFDGSEFDDTEFFAG